MRNGHGSLHIDIVISDGRLHIDIIYDAPMSLANSTHLVLGKKVRVDLIVEPAIVHENLHNPRDKALLPSQAIDSRENE